MKKQMVAQFNKSYEEVMGIFLEAPHLDLDYESCEGRL
jgi:hypothetical protein